MAKQTQTETAEKKPVAKIMANRFSQAELKRNVWRVFIPEGVTPEDVRDPEYWQHVAQFVQPGDCIEAIWDDMTFYAEYIVVASARLHAYLVPKFPPARLNDVANAGRKYEDNLLVMFRGTFQKYAVMNGDEVLKHGFNTHDEATVYMMEYRKNILKAA